MVRSQPPITISGPDSGPETQREYVPPGDRANLILELKHDGVARTPVLAVYAPGKPVPYNYGCIDAVYRECLATFVRNPDASATVIGVHIPPLDDDPRLDEVLGALVRLRGSVDYVGPGAEDRDSAKERGIRLGPQTLEDLLGPARAR
jgi:hypothetical protein